MEPAEIDILEANIKRAIETIRKLQSENHRLKQENESLLNRIRENERFIQESDNQNRAGSDIADQLSIHQEKEAKIKQKIRQMLEKLETFQQLSAND